MYSAGKVKREIKIGYRLQKKSGVKMSLFH